MITLSNGTTENLFDGADPVRMAARGKAGEAGGKCTGLRSQIDGILPVRRSGTTVRRSVVQGHVWRTDAEEVPVVQTHMTRL